MRRESEEVRVGRERVKREGEEDSTTQLFRCTPRGYTHEQEKQEQTIRTLRKLPVSS